MPNQHKFRLMRPHSKLAEQLPGVYPESINTALARYLFLTSNPPEFSESEWNLMRDACNGWATQLEPPEALVQGLVLQVEDAIQYSQLDQKWGVDASLLMARLQSLSHLETIAIIQEVERWWLHHL